MSTWGTTVPANGDRRARAVATRIRVGVVLLLAAAIGAALVHPAARGALLEGWALLVRRDLDGLRRWGRGLGPWAPLGTTALMIAQALAAPVPAVLITWTNSWMFGPFWGGLLSIAQATLAAVVCFYLARALGRPVVRRLASERAVDRADGLVARYGVVAVFVGRLLPFVPFDPLSYAAGLTGMRARTFAAATLLGQLPAGMAYAYLGQEIDRPDRLAVGLAGMLLGSLVLGAVVWRVLRARRPPDANHDRRCRGRYEDS